MDERQPLSGEPERLGVTSRRSEATALQSSPELPKLSRTLRRSAAARKGQARPKARNPTK
eukprot:8850327-Alexandrium_andersonii.AAC.1